MGIAISLIFATALVLPGILLNYYIRKGTWKSPVVLQSFQNELAKGVLYSIIIHSLLLWIIDHFCSIRYDLIFSVIFESYSDLTDSEAKVIYSSIYYVLLYFLLSYFFAILSGIVTFKIIRWTHLDLIFPNNQFNNEWHYYFSGEARVFGLKKPSWKLINDFLKGEIECVYLSFTLEKNSESYLYWGLLYEYYFDKKGNLDKIVLTEVSRRKLTDDFHQSGNNESAPEDLVEVTDNQSSEFTDTRFYPIRGEYIVFDYTEINDLNIEYLIFEEEEAIVTNT